MSRANALIHEWNDKNSTSPWRDVQRMASSTRTILLATKVGACAVGNEDTVGM